LRRDFTIS